MLSVFASCLTNDLYSLIRSRAQWFNPVVFFSIIIALFGIGLGAEQALLVKISPAIIWITFLLTSLFTVESMMHRDQEEGILEQLVLSPYPLWWLILAKSLALWITACLPLLLTVPLLGLTLNLSSMEIGLLLLSLLIGSPALILLAMIGAAITIALPRSGVFLALLCLPLYIPLLILGQSSVIDPISSWPLFQLLLLGAMSVLAITLAPHAIAGALKAAMDE